MGWGPAGRVTRRVPQGDTKLRAEGSEAVSHVDIRKRSRGKGTASPRIPRPDKVSLTSVTPEWGTGKAVSILPLWSPSVDPQAPVINQSLSLLNCKIRNTATGPWGGSSRRTSVACLPWQGLGTQDPKAQHWEGLEVAQTRSR